MKNIFWYQTRLGPIGIAEREGAISNLLFPGELLAGAEERETPLLQAAGRELTEYLAGERKEFQLPLQPQGTEFQKRVWQVLVSIPHGKTLSYGQVAEMLGDKQAARAVGMANNQNPIPIFIPCHRVVGADGKLRGYRGGLGIKKQLLALEQYNY